MADDAGLTELYRNTETWASRTSALRGLISAILGFFALAGWAVAGILAFSISQMFPLIRTEVVPLIVDKNTGYMETVTTLQKGNRSISELESARASFVGNYVLRREMYDPRYVRDTYDMIALWSDPNGQAWRSYDEEVNPSNPRSPVAVIGSDGDIQPDLLSVNLVGRDRDAFLYNVRFETRERVKGGDVTNRWAANVRMKRVDMAATNRVRIFNPFTFQVIEYRKVPESMPTGLPR
ncbi:type IV secretion system protein [Mesorhizobium sp. 65-26]|uniref:virB8 family protein n=1 Tax=Mesorhizobium sp. 65-26 TaxID=1895781 RepID=UPI000B2A5905|nr:type IV secretion system protein [Mesorhizobium sp. 65-26]